MRNGQLQPAEGVIRPMFEHFCCSLEPVNHMSTVITIENERTDPEGHPLVPARPRDIFRHKRVWAVYRFQPACRNADARCSEFVTVTMAKGAADQLNRTREDGAVHYFRVYRLAA